MNTPFAFAPIVLFTFKRPEHTRRTLESLAKNPEFIDSPLIVYCDGARSDSEVAQVMETRRLVRVWPHPNKTIIERDRNWGLANSVIDGVTSLCNSYGKIIVVEDDMVVSIHFLNYMNLALVKFQDDDRVISIHGYAYPIEGLPEAYFIKGASCWGWATWKRGWDLFEADAKKLLNELEEKNLMYRFNVYNSYPFKRMLVRQINGKIDSWAIRWYASAITKDKLTLHPGISLVENIGLDGSGVHCDPEAIFDRSSASQAVNFEHIEVKESLAALKLWVKYLKTTRRRKFFAICLDFKLLVRTSKRFILEI